MAVTFRPALAARAALPHPAIQLLTTPSPLPSPCSPAPLHTPQSSAASLVTELVGSLAADITANVQQYDFSPAITQVGRSPFPP